MAGLPLGEPPLRAADGGSDRTKGVYQAIEHEPFTGDNTKNGVETSRGEQGTLSAPKYQWNPTKIGAEVESEGREIFAQQIHRCHMGQEVEIPKRKRMDGTLGLGQSGSGQRAAGSGQRAAGSGKREA